jgi:hypothetical protein
MEHLGSQPSQDPFGDFGANGELWRDIPDEVLNDMYNQLEYVHELIRRVRMKVFYAKCISQLLFQDLPSKFWKSKSVFKKFNYSLF